MMSNRNIKLHNPDRFSEDCFIADEKFQYAIKKACDKLASKIDIYMDGFPRSMDQVEMFGNLIQTPEYKDKNLEPDLVLLLQVPDDYIFDRILGRSQCANCKAMYHEKFKTPKVFGVCDICGGKEFTKRADDTHETVVSRLRTYRSVTAPVIPYYEEKGLLRCVDGTGPIDVVSEKIRKIVGY